MSQKYIIALDQGTTSSRAVLLDRSGAVQGIAQQTFRQIYPHPGWVEHDPQEILSSQLGALTKLLVTHNVQPPEIDSIGIANQRETTIVWNRETGKPLANAIVWQCRRTASMIEDLCSDPQVKHTIIEKTGLIPDAYFSASKIKWLLDNIPGAREDARAGKLAFGTVDSWLIWSLTQGSVHATDVTNASRTMLYNIHTGQWDTRLLDLFDIPASLLPEVRPSSSFFGETKHPNVIGGIPVCGVAGDQQAALFGHGCLKAGQAKNTYGTGCFLLMHTGKEACQSTQGLITTIAASPPTIHHTEYALEGSVFIAGALIQWLRDELGLISSVEESQALAQSVADNAGVYIVPAFTGLGAPYWDAEARGAFYGLTRGTTKAHVVRAAHEAIAYQVHDLVKAMEQDAQSSLSILNVDGGAASNDFLMQFQSDILQIPLVRPRITEATALGVGFLSGLSSGFWKDTRDLENQSCEGQTFNPIRDKAAIEKLLMGWEDALRRTRTS